MYSEESDPNKLVAIIARMRFARRVFLIAGVFGVLLLPPMYFFEDLLGRRAPPPITHPEFYYGFVGVTLAWQLVYLLIAQDPVRYRPMMLLAMMAKLSFAIAVFVLLALGRVWGWMALGAIADLIFVLLFGYAYASTRTTSTVSLTRGANR